jgi:hypothetical protein
MMNINDLTLGQLKEIQDLFKQKESEMEVKLENALRLWKCEGGGLSLSSVANNGIKGGRLNDD